MNKNIVSPCISICKTDPLSGYCYGCGRTNEEKITWKYPETSNIWKKQNLTTLKDRLVGWQKDAFEKSYLCKKKIGISLFKKKLMDSKSS